MMNTLTLQFVTLARTVGGAVRERVRARPHEDSGLSSLELVILALGLMAIAALLVGALYAAVSSRVNQIK